MAAIPPEVPLAVAPVAPVPPVPPSPPGSGLTFEDLPRHIRVYRITTQELNALASIKTGLHLTFFGMAFGAFLALWIVLKTSPNLDADTRNLFITLTAGSGVLTAFFFAMSLIEGLGARAFVNDIRTRTQ